MNANLPSRNPRRVAAGRLNRLKRGPLTPEGGQRLREAALANRPWLSSTGPRTASGKARSAANGKRRKTEEHSIRSIRHSLAEVTSLARGLTEARELVSELLNALP